MPLVNHAKQADACCVVLKQMLLWASWALSPLGFPLCLLGQNLLVFLHNPLWNEWLPAGSFLVLHLLWHLVLPTFYIQKCFAPHLMLEVHIPVTHDTHLCRKKHWRLHLTRCSAKHTLHLFAHVFGMHSNAYKTQNVACEHLYKGILGVNMRGR